MAARATTETVSAVTDPTQHLGTVFLRGETEAINAHAAHQQPRAQANGISNLRTDRMYHTAYEGENPGKLLEGATTGICYSWLTCLKLRDCRKLA